MSEKFAPGSAGARRVALARDYCATLKNMVNGLALFPAGHPTVATYFARLKDYLAQYHEREGSLVLEVAAGGLLLEGQPVLVPDGKSALISDPIFRDGVTEISFARETPEHELSQLCDIWAISMVPDAESGQTFTTRCWEANFNGIRIVSLDNFIEYLDDEAEGSLNALLDELEAMRSLGPYVSPTASPLPRLSPGDLQWLRSCGVTELDAVDLDPQNTQPPPAFQGLDAEEIKTLGGEIALGRARQSLPAIEALAFATLEATPDERAELVTALGAIFVSIARAVGLEQVRRAVTAFVDAAPKDTGGPARRFAALPAVLDGLGTPALLSLCSASITSTAADPAVDGILQSLQPGAAAALLDCINAAPTLRASEIFLPRLLQLQPAPDVLCSRIAATQPQVAAALLNYAKTLPEPVWIEVHIAAIAHPNAEIRQLAAGRVPKEMLVKRPESLYPLANDDDPNLRQMAITALLSAQDASAVPHLVKMLDRSDLNIAERRRVLRSLGGIPTRDAITALRKEFRTQTNPEISATCAMSLGRAGDEFSRQAFETVLAARRAHPDLKKACADAMRMLDARRDPDATAGRRDVIA